jgi:outer membrane protein assembly factor BamB
VEDSRLFVGSGDGWLYAFEAATGKLLWRFRVAPRQRKISVYGRLSSTWPVASGVLADHGVVYAAAGIASFDGTHVVALDAASGHIVWQNNSSGHLLGEGRVTGVSVQGHMLLHAGRLYMAGGNVVSPAVYDARDGRCLNQLADEWGGQTPPDDPDWQYTDDVRRVEVQQKKWGKAPRGCELFPVGEQVVAFDRLLYSPQQYWIGRYFPRQFMPAGTAAVPIRASGNRIARLADTTNPGQPLWDVESGELPRCLAVCDNAVLVAGARQSQEAATSQCTLTARALSDGSSMWSQPLPATPAWWGLATDHTGRVFITLQDGSVLCFRPRQTP